MCSSDLGGVGEEVARPVLFLQVVDFLFVGGAPRSSAVDLLPLPRPQLYGAAVGVFPLPDSAGRRIWSLKFSWKKLRRFGSTTTASSGVGPSGPAIGDFPLAQGLFSIQGVKENRSGGAPPTAPWTAEWLGCRKAGSLILFSLWTFL